MRTFHSLTLKATIVEAWEISSDTLPFAGIVYDKEIEKDYRLAGYRSAPYTIIRYDDGSREYIRESFENVASGMPYPPQ